MVLTQRSGKSSARHDLEGGGGSEAFGSDMDGPGESSDSPRKLPEPVVAIPRRMPSQGSSRHSSAVCVWRGGVIVMIMIILGHLFKEIIFSLK